LVSSRETRKKRKKKTLDIEEQKTISTIEFDLVL
jgi:hypothetical protein